MLWTIHSLRTEHNCEQWTHCWNDIVEWVKRCSYVPFRLTANFLSISMSRGHQTHSAWTSGNWKWLNARHVKHDLIICASTSARISHWRTRLPLLSNIIILRHGVSPLRKRPNERIRDEIKRGMMVAFHFAHRRGILKMKMTTFCWKFWFIGSMMPLLVGHPQTFATHFIFSNFLSAAACVNAQQTRYWRMFQSTRASSIVINAAEASDGNILCCFSRAEAMLPVLDAAVFCWPKFRRTGNSLVFVTSISTFCLASVFVGRQKKSTIQPHDPFGKQFVLYSYPFYALFTSIIIADICEKAWSE